MVRCPSSVVKDRTPTSPRSSTTDYGQRTTDASPPRLAIRLANQQSDMPSLLPLQDVYFEPLAALVVLGPDLAAWGAEGHRQLVVIDLVDAKLGFALVFALGRHGVLAVLDDHHEHDLRELLVGDFLAVDDGRDAVPDPVDFGGFLVPSLGGREGHDREANNRSQQLFHLKLLGGDENTPRRRAEYGIKPWLRNGNGGVHVVGGVVC